MCKTAILLYCSHTAGVLHTFVLLLYNLMGPGKYFLEKNVFADYLIFLKSILWQPVMHSQVNFSIIITLHSRVHFSINFIKNEIVKYMSRVSRDHTFLLWCTAYNLWTFIWIVHFELLFRLKGTEQIYFPSILISVLWWDP